MADDLRAEAMRELARRELARRRGQTEVVIPNAEPPRQMGSFLPISRGPDGVSFDSNAGIVGMIKRVMTQPDMSAFENRRYDAMTDAGDVFQNGQLVGNTEMSRNQLPSRMMEAASLVSPLNPALRAGDRVIPGMARRSMEQVPVKPPSADALRQAGSRGFNEVRDMGVDFKSQAVKQMAEKSRLALEQDGILAELAPKTFKILDKLASPPDKSVAPLSGVIAARRALKNARLDFTNPTEKLAADRLIAQLDDFIGKPNPKAVLAGPAPAAGKRFQEANANYAAAKRSDRITGKLADADRQAAVANSGQNIENAIRQRANDILKSDKLKAGFSKEELKALEDVAVGNATRNTIRFVGNLLGGGGGLGMGVTGSIGAAGGAALGGPYGAAIGASAVPALGMGLKRLGGRMTRNAMSGVDELARMRSPLYQEMLRQEGQRFVTPERGAVPLRLLLGTEAGRKR